MWMSKAMYGLVISLLILLLQVPDASAQDVKADGAQNSSKKKSKTKRKAPVALAATSKTSSGARTRPVRRAVVVNDKRKVAIVRKKSKAVAVRRVPGSSIKARKRKLTLHASRAPLRLLPAAPSADVAKDLAEADLTRSLILSSNVAFALDESNSQVLFEKKSDSPMPIASITKLMTALVVVEADQNMDEILEVTNDDIDRIKHTSSRLPIGAKLSRADMLHIALMSSENRAASALGRNYPGGLSAFVAAMNAKAKALGMTNTHYVEPTGLSSENVASARDLAKLVAAVHDHPVLAQFSTNTKYEVDTGRRTLHYVNSNRLIGNEDWDIELQKTGYITEAGRCLVMQVKIDDRPVVMVFLDSKGQHSRFADAGRLRKWVLQKISSPTPVQVKLAEGRS
jgi:D-alanyl-D-alanine endopeptidase (penicillin-binding protein 7)